MTLKTHLSRGIVPVFLAAVLLPAGCSGQGTFVAMDSVLVLFLADPACDGGEVGPRAIAISYRNGMVGCIFLNPHYHERKVHADRFESAQ